MVNSPLFASKKNLALLYSLLLWPGAGHIYLGQKKKGYFLAILTIILLLVLFFIFEIELIHQIQVLSNPQDAFRNTGELLLKVWLVQKTKLITCLLGLLGVWGYAAADILIRK